MADNTLLTKKETADYLKVSTRTIDDYRKAGKITCHKPGKKVLFKRTEIIEFLEKGRQVKSN